MGYICVATIILATVPHNRERRSKMILRREDCHKDDGELDREIVTSASCTSVSSASIPRPKRATWPVIRKVKMINYPYKNFFLSLSQIHSLVVDLLQIFMALK